MTSDYTKQSKLPKGIKWRQVSTHAYRDALNRLRLMVTREVAVTAEGLPVRHERTGKR